MFDWLWEFLYSISKSLLRLIDGIISCANKLCGIETITINGMETDFLTYLLRSETLTNGFRITAVLGFIVLIFFTIARIIILVEKEKPDVSPAQISIKAFKSLIIFFFVPVVMLTAVWALNTMMTVIYSATINGTTSLGTFLFQAFSQDCEVYNQTIYDKIIVGELSFADIDIVNQAIDVSDFDFIFSWITSIVLIVILANSLIQFVDRCISIAVLFLVSPFSISSSVLDDGARFKLWREQVLIKFFSGYGIIIYLSMYCLLVSLVVPSSVVFFDSAFTNNILKLIIIIGGGYAMQRSTSLIGNLISQGAGYRETMDSSLGRLGAAAATGGLKLIGKGIGAGFKKLFGGGGGGSNKGNASPAPENSGQNTGNQNEQFNGNPKYNDSNSIGNKLRNDDGDSKSFSDSGNDNIINNDSFSDASENGNGSRFDNDDNEINERRSNEIRNSLFNNPSINDVDDDEE